MTRTSIAGTALAAVSLTLLGAELLTGLVLSDSVAASLCGTDVARAGEGAPGDRACGFDADMQLVAACVLCALVGLGAAIAGAFEGGDRRPRRAPRVAAPRDDRRR